ncbi:MAG TPA: hypothetical protein VHC73_11825 [Vitreimonas sp.]|jgi:uncharacterized membrane protein|nr:hypothetical protein [Vitreimonas sp.]
MSQTNFAPASQQPGRGTAILGYGLFLLSIPSAAIFALIGVIVALSGVSTSAPLPRAHLQNQVHIWMVAFWWAVALALLGAVGMLLMPVLIGFPILWIVGALGFLVMLWFTIKSALGLLALLDGREP